jgi:hypothetical protein
MEWATPFNKKKESWVEVASPIISPNSSDRDATQSLAERLGVEGFAALFLDFEPQQGILAGRKWERELYAQLWKTDAVIFGRNDEIERLLWFVQPILQRG